MYIYNLIKNNRSNLDYINDLKGELNRCISQENYLKDELNTCSNEKKYIESQYSACIKEKDSFILNRDLFQIRYSNIKTNTTINLPIQINVNKIYTKSFLVDWGDGKIDKNLNHTYKSDIPSLIIKVSGDAITEIDITKAGKDQFESLIREIISYGDNNNIKIINLSEYNLINFIFPNKLPVTLQDASNMFSNAINIPDLSKLYVSNVTNMSGMFKSCENFNQSLNKWDVSNVTDMSRMFEGCITFNQPLNNWDVSNVTDMSAMFLDCRIFNNPLNNWDVSNVTDMSQMFYNCKNFDLFTYLSKWKDKVQKVYNASNMFKDVPGATCEILESWGWPKISINNNWCNA